MTTRRRAAQSRKSAIHFLSFILLAGFIGSCRAQWSEFFNSNFGLLAPAPAVETPAQLPRLTLHTLVPDARFPVNLAFLPNGDLLYTEKHTGLVRIVTSDGVLLPEPLLDVDVSGIGDSGLLGLALHPRFAENGFVYVGYSANYIPFDNVFLRVDFRVERFTIRDRAVVPGSARLILTIPGNRQPGHEGGNIHFGPDGRLYVSVGDRRLNTLENVEAQEPAILAGKMLRYDEDGGIPTDNPFGGAVPTYALGLRNTFDFAFDPVTGRMFACDNGPEGDDEFNLIVPGGNYGWPDVSGRTDLEHESSFAAAHADYHEPLAMTDIAPTGIAFQTTNVYGDEYVNEAFVAEWLPGTIRRIRLSADRRSVVSTDVFFSGIPGGMNDLEIGPDGRIFVCTANAVYRIDPL